MGGLFGYQKVLIGLLILGYEMALCEMCGRTGELSRTIVEGVELSVCSYCGKHGKRLQTPQQSYSTTTGSPTSSSRNIKPETEWKVIDDFSKLLRTARERSELSQEDFAAFLQERESVVSKWESGTVKPSLETAQKLQKILGLTLIVLDEVVGGEIVSSQKSAEFTLGDFVKVRQR